MSVASCARSSRSSLAQTAVRRCTGAAVASVGLELLFLRGLVVFVLRGLVVGVVAGVVAVVVALVVLCSSCVRAVAIVLLKLLLEVAVARGVSGVVVTAVFEFVGIVCFGVCREWDATLVLLVWVSQGLLIELWV